MRRPRHGSTLIELLVALVLLDLALLSLAAVGAATARRVGEAGRRSRAANAASNRIERLAALPCAAVASGSVQLERGVTETWIVERHGPTLSLTDSIHNESRPREPVVLRARVPCA